MGSIGIRKCEAAEEMNSEVVALAKRLRRRNPKTGERKSLRAIAAELASLRHLNVNGRTFAAESIKAMVSKRACAWSLRFGTELSTGTFHDR